MLASGGEVEHQRIQHDDCWRGVGVLLCAQHVCCEVCHTLVCAVHHAKHVLRRRIAFTARWQVPQLLLKALGTGISWAGSPWESHSFLQRMAPKRVVQVAMQIMMASLLYGCFPCSIAGEEGRCPTLFSIISKKTCLILFRI